MNETITAGKNTSFDTAVAKISMRERISYSLGDFGSNLIFATVMAYLMFFYTDIYGISASVVGTLFLFARIFDAVNDPIMGAIADRTRTRWGSYRPWLLWMTVPFVVVAVLTFTTPDFSEQGKIIYACITYILLIIVYTAINIPYGVLGAVMTQDTDERVKLGMSRMIGAMVGMLLTSALAFPLVKFFGKDNPAKGYQLTILLFALIGGLSFILCFKGTKERVAPPEKRHTLKDEFSALKGNRPWLVLFLVSLFFLGHFTIANGTTIYYFNYVLERPAFVPLFLTVTTLALLVGIVISPLISKRVSSKKWMTIFGLGISVVFTFMKFYFTGTAYAFIFTSVSNIGIGIVQGVIHSMYSDSIEYGAWKNGIHAPGIVYSSLSFAHKFAMGIAGAATGWLLTAFEYVPGIVQSAKAVSGINAIFTLVPAALSLVSMLIMFFYNLDRKKYYEILENLKSRGIALGAED